MLKDKIIGKLIKFEPKGISLSEIDDLLDTLAEQPNYNNRKKDFEVLINK